MTYSASPQTRPLQARAPSYPARKPAEQPLALTVTRDQAGNTVPVIDRAVSLIRSEFAQFDPGFSLSSGEYHVSKPVTLSCTAPPALGFGVCLSISARTSFAFGAETTELTEPSMFLFSIPSPMVETIRHPGGATTRFVAVRLSPQFLEQLLRTGMQEPVDTVYELLGAAGKRFAVRYESLAEPVRQVAEQIQECELQGACRQIYLRGKALELFSLCCDGFSKRSRGTSDACLRQSDVARLYRARDLLLADLRKEWSLFQLASDVGLNVKKLKVGFRDVFETTVFRFLREERLKRAEQLIRGKGWNVDQTAYAVGYSSPSHFSQLFRQRFGLAPCTYRQEFAGVPLATNGSADPDRK